MNFKVDLTNSTLKTSYLMSLAAKVVLWSAGFFILIYLGYGSMKEAFRKVDIPLSDINLSDSGLKAFFTGFMIALSDPQNIIFWIGIYGSVLASTTEMTRKGYLLWYSSAIFIGILFWDLFISISVHYRRRFVNRDHMKWIYIAAGVVLMGFGIYFGFCGIKGFSTLVMD